MVAIPSPTSSIAQLFICMKREIVVAIRGKSERERERERERESHGHTPHDPSLWGKCEVAMAPLVSNLGKVRGGGGGSREEERGGEGRER